MSDARWLLKPSRGQSKFDLGRDIDSEWNAVSCMNPIKVLIGQVDYVLLSVVLCHDLLHNCLG